MNKRTYVGLDVHARSVKGCAIDRGPVKSCVRAWPPAVPGLPSGCPGCRALSWWSMRRDPRDSAWPGGWLPQGSSAWSQRRPGSSVRPGTG
jgi:hypothetical protein